VSLPIPETPLTVRQIRQCSGDLFHERQQSTASDPLVSSSNHEKVNTNLAPAVGSRRCELVLSTTKGKTMQLREIMTTDVEVIRPESPLTEAARKMKSLDVGALPVCDGRRLLGMITDRDITIRATAEERDPRNTLVRDCMSPEMVYCFEDQDPKEAERIMQEKQIRRLPVLTREKQLAGIVALGDLATKTGDVQQVGRTVREVSQRSTGAGT